MLKLFQFISFNVKKNVLFNKTLNIFAHNEVKTSTDICFVLQNSSSVVSDNAQPGAHYQRIMEVKDIILLTLQTLVFSI